MFGIHVHINRAVHVAPRRYPRNPYSPKDYVELVLTHSKTIKFMTSAIQLFVWNFGFDEFR
jgi:hypothetical protein